MTQKRPLPDQLTLFQCIRQQEERDHMDEDHHSKKQCHGDDEPGSSGSSSASSMDNGRTDPQTNYISIQSPSGPTTVIVNSTSASTSKELFAENSGDQQPLEPPDDVAATPAFQPIRPVNIKFPVTLFSGKSRSFSPGWYHSYPWLEYSVSRDACFCYPCRLFGAVSGGQSRPEMAFAVTGFRDWKHATEKSGSLTCHNNSLTHKQAVVAWSQYTLNVQRGTTISERMGSVRAEQIENNRHYLKTVAEILLLCSQQEIALRGHRESPTSVDRGNFLEILKLVANHDQIIHHRLTDGPRNATYTSAEIQNELLNVMGGMVQKKISVAAQKAGLYSILADESKNCSKREQLAIVLRYVDVDTGSILEHFLTYVEAVSLDAEGLSTYILNTLTQHGLDPTCIVSQGYDGASVMSGRCSGVQQRIKEIAPQAVYVHCYAHCLNLALVDTTRSITEASDFFALMEVLYVFMSTSKAHEIYLQKQSELHPSKQIRRLQKLSDTRWACRYFAIDAVCCTFDSLLAALETMSNGENREKATEAKGILLQVRSFKFLLLLVIFSRILSCTKSLSDQLQSRSIDMAKAADLVSATVAILKEFRADSKWEHLFKYVQDVASLHSITADLPRTHRLRQLPQRYECGVVMESTGFRETVMTCDQLKDSLYFPILDAMLSELDRRFAEKNLDHMRAIQACSPSSSDFLQPNSILTLAESYGLDVDSLTVECSLARQTLLGKDLESISNVLLELSSLRLAFPSLIKLLQIALSIVVSTAHCERSFSALKRIKTYLRSTMTEQRLVDLAVLSIEKELSKQISLDEVVNEFASKDKNRRILLS